MKLSAAQQPDVADRRAIEAPRGRRRPQAGSAVRTWWPPNTCCPAANRQDRWAADSFPAYTIMTVEATFRLAGASTVPDCDVRMIVEETLAFHDRFWAAGRGDTAGTLHSVHTKLKLKLEPEIVVWLRTSQQSPRIPLWTAS
jgi:hypothetical protein